jgi:hypothetical protein
MSIKSQLDDALFLKANERYLGAFTVLMLAVAASSRLTFPQGTPSKVDLKKLMGDGEAFRLFLGGRIRKMLMGLDRGPDEGTAGVTVPVNGKSHDLAYIFYKYYRNGLIHESELPNEVEFVPSQQACQGIRIENRGFSVCISVVSNKLSLDYGWVDLLIGAVKRARCNGAEFGIEHYDLLPNIGVESEAFLTALAEQHATSRGRVDIIQYGLESMPPESVAAMADEKIIKGFRYLCATEAINGGAMTGLRVHGLMDESGAITPRGIELFRQIALGFRRVRVA